MRVEQSAKTQAPIEEQIDDQDVGDIRHAIEQMKRGEVIDWKEFSGQIRGKYLGA